MPIFPETRVSLILRLSKPTDVHAWHEFSEIYAPTLYALARRRGLQAADAEDVTQETLFAVAGAIARFNPDQTRAKFRTWLARIARNLIADFCAGKVKRPLVQSVSDSWLRAAQDMSQSEDVVLDQEFTQEFRSILFQLAARRIQGRVAPTVWQAFHATFILQQPAHEVAKTLGMSLGYLYVARCRVLKMLREDVQELERKHSSNSPLIPESFDLGASSLLESPGES